MPGQKLGALLALLVLSPGQPRTREEIIDLLWPETDFDEARDRFRQLVVRLRKLLEPEGIKPGSVLIANRTQIGIAAGHPSDVAEFLQHLRRAAMASEPLIRVQHLQSALALYAGEFAPGFYLDILLTQRERLAAMAEAARERLAALIAHLYPLGVPPPDEHPPSSPGIAVPVRTQNRFFGRDRERHLLGELLAEHRLVTLIGPGGTGKTRLAEELNAPFVSLSALRQGSGIPQTIITALELPDSDEAAMARLQNAFAEKETLLVLDNVEQLVATDGATVIATLLTSIPTLRLLVTSRLKLGLPQECVFPLAPLPEEDAVALFVNRAQQANAEFQSTRENMPTIAELCRRLDGLPLAIELAASRAAILTPSQIQERLSRRFDLLADRRRDREERHTSLRAALDWGWCLLAPDVQRFFASLSVFHGSFSLEAAETITGEYLAIDYLQSLADASFLLVEKAGGVQRFRQLETLREYGLEKLGSDEEQKRMFRAHSDFYSECAKRWRSDLNGAGFATAMARFKQDHDNFLTALDRTMESDPLGAIDLCWNLWDYWSHSYWKRGALEYLNRAEAAARSLSLGHEKWASLHTILGNSYKGIQEYPRAIAHHQEALRHQEQWLIEADAAGNQEDTARGLRSRAGTLHNVANILFYENQLDVAESHYREAEELNRRSGNEAWLARNLNGLCHIYGEWAFSTEDQAERRRLLEMGLTNAEEAVTLCRRVQQDYFLCLMLDIQVSLLLGLERDAEALTILGEGIELIFSLEHWSALMNFCHHYHHIALRCGQWETAVQFLGAVYGTAERWSLTVEAERASYLALTDSPRNALPEILGAERYDLLYQSGFDASTDSLRALAATMHRMPH